MSQTLFFRKTHIILIFRFIVLPVLLWGFLSIPQLYYAFNYSEIWKEFSKSFINHNFQFVFILIGGLAWINYSFKNASRFIFPLILFVLFMIRFIDIGLEKTFHISFSPIVFRSTSLDSMLIAFNLFGMELLIISLIGILGSIAFFPRLCWHYFAL